MTKIDQPVHDLAPAVPGERRDLHGRAGRLSYYVQGPTLARRSDVSDPVGEQVR